MGYNTNLGNAGKGDMFGGFKAAGKSFENNVWTPLGRAMGYDPKPYREGQAKMDAIQQEAGTKTQGVMDQMKGADATYTGKSRENADEYLKKVDAAGEGYMHRVNQLNDESQAQAKDARHTYTNTIQPRQKELMESAMQNARGAMSLEEAQDPNNKVASGVRDLYNKEGQSIRNQGMADAGVLAALGAQATAGQMGGMPVFTGSNLQTMNAQNQRQSGEAFAAAQKRMMDLREQGLGKGLEQSNAMYDRGQMAQDSAAGRVADYDQGYSNQLGRDQAFRGESQGYAAENLGVQRGMAGERLQIGNDLTGLEHGLARGQGDQEIGMIGQDAGYRTGAIQNDLKQRESMSARGAMGGIMGMVGGMFGGGGGGGGGSPTAAPQQGYVPAQQGGVSQGMNQGIWQGANGQQGGMYSGGRYGAPTYDQYRQQGGR